jgi:hypothetical protein
MIAFVKKHWISLGLLFVLALVGLVLVYRQTPMDSWRIEYVFDTRNTEKLPRIAQADTVFLVEGKLVRNYTGSIADTMRHLSVSRYEVKVNLPVPTTKQQVWEFGNRVLKSDYIKVKKVRFRETQRNKSMLLYCVLLGFFLGIVVEFIRRLKKDPRSAQNG